MTQPKRIAITGAAGQICYSMLFRIAAGDIYGPDQPVSLHLLEITPALGMLEAVKMELDDCAFPLLNDVVVTDDPKVALNKVDAALFVGAKPRGPGMERSDLITDNGKIFSALGAILNEVGSPDCKVCVVGNPANTNAYIPNGVIDHMASWVQGTPDGDWVSMAVPSDGSYGIDKGLIYSFPVQCKDGDYTIISDLDVTSLCKSSHFLPSRLIILRVDVIARGSSSTNAVVPARM